MSDKNKLSAIDLVKVVAAVLVLLSHVGLFRTYSSVMDMWFINIVFRWCVPFFFVCSGFFMPKTWGGYKRYFTRILLIYLIWTVFYMLYFRMPMGRELIKNIVFNGVIVPFWYFPSLLLCVSLCYLLNHFVSSFWICIIAMLMYIIGLFGDTYSAVNPMASFLQKSILKYHYRIFNYTTRDGILFGTLYVSVGNYLKEHKDIIKKIKGYRNYKIKMSITILICWVFEALEIYVATTYMLGSDLNILISTIPMTILIFFLAYNINVDKKTSLILRKFSVLIYVIHPFVIDILVNIENSIAKFIGTLTVTMVIAGGIIIISSKISFLRKLY